MQINHHRLIGGHQGRKGGLRPRDRTMICTLAMALVQLFAMNLFLRVLQFRFFVSALLATIVAMLVDFGMLLLKPDAQD